MAIYINKNNPLSRFILCNCQCLLALTDFRRIEIHRIPLTKYSSYNWYKYCPITGINIHPITGINIVL